MPETISEFEIGLFLLNLFNTALHIYQFGQAQTDLFWHHYIGSDSGLSVAAWKQARLSLQKLLSDGILFSLVARAFVVPNAIAVDGILGLIPPVTVAALGIMLVLTVGSLWDAYDRDKLIKWSRRNHSES